MNTPKRLSIVCTVIVGAVSCQNDTANAVEEMRLRNYSFSQVANTNEYTQVINSPAIADNGAVAYRTYHQDGSTAVFYWSDGVTKKLIGSDFTYADGRFDFISGAIGISNSGVVAFATGYISPRDDAVEGIYTINPNGDLKGVFINDPSKPFYSHGMDINDSGEVAFLKSATSYQDLYLAAADGPTRIFPSGQYRGRPSVPEINSGGLVAFAGNYYAFGYILTYFNGELLEIDSAHGTTYYQMSAPGLNDLGEIAYVRQEGPNEYALVLYKDGIPQVLPVADAAIGNVEINNSGVIVFQGSNPEGRFGVRKYDRGVIEDVLVFGDSLFGKQPRSINLYDFNDQGQLALRVKHTDDSVSVIVATPIPEPTAHQLFVAACVFALLSGVRKR